jgi:hypothetical protein
MPRQPATATPVVVAGTKEVAIVGIGGHSVGTRSPFVKSTSVIGSIEDADTRDRTKNGDRLVVASKTL